MEGNMGAVDRGCAVFFTAIICWAALGSLARADWATCQNKPTRSCLLEEALRGESGPLAGKERLDVLLQANVLNHLEYATAADIKEAQRLAKEPSGSRYLYLAIRSLAAANQWQDAFDLVLSSGTGVPGMRDFAFAELTRALVKAGHQDRVLVFAKQVTSPPPLSPHYMFAQYVRALVEAGKIDDALAVIGEVQGKIEESDGADMLTAVAQAYAKRGDKKLADQFFDKAQATLETGLQKPVTNDPVRQYDPISLRFALISLWALRGDTAAVKRALQQPPTTDGPANRAAQEFRMQGYRRVVASLLQRKQFPLGLEVAKSMPGSAFDRDRTLGDIALANAVDGRIDDARALLSSFGDKTDPRIRASVIAGLAAALAKAGDVRSALQTAAQIGDSTARRATLFAIAQTLPP
jgi:tetratricopeptide (TPR) repeat protein